MATMQTIDLSKACREVVKTARLAGALMRKNHHRPKKANEVTRHDIKLELDVRCQQLIEKHLAKSFPEVPVVGEEGFTGDASKRYRWVIDPIDGTVNFAYGIPHAAVSIALQEFQPGAKGAYPDGYITVVGVIYDPFCDELWTAVRGRPALLNGRKVRVSSNSALGRAVVSLGFSKTAINITKMMPCLLRLAPRVRKIRMMGSAALALVYVAGGRFDAYLERGLRLWDIAAGGLIVECAGGEFFIEPVKGPHTYRVTCTNGKLRSKLPSVA